MLLLKIEISQLRGPNHVNNPFRPKVLFSTGPHCQILDEGQTIK